MLCLMIILKKKIKRDLMSILCHADDTQLSVSLNSVVFQFAVFEVIYMTLKTWMCFSSCCSLHTTLLFMLIILSKSIHLDHGRPFSLPHRCSAIVTPQLEIPQKHHTRFNSLINGAQPDLWPIYFIFIYSIWLWTILQWAFFKLLSTWLFHIVHNGSPKQHEGQFQLKVFWFLGI